jgi:hypothetical protein
MDAVGVRDASDGSLVVCESARVARQCPPQGVSGHHGGIKRVEQALGRQWVAGQSSVAHRQPAEAGRAAMPLLCAAVYPEWPTGWKSTVAAQGDQISLPARAGQQLCGPSQVLGHGQIRIGMEG